MKHRLHITRIFAGFLAVAVSPVAAYAINTGAVKPPEPINPNNGAVILYQPAENGGVSALPVDVQDAADTDELPEYVQDFIPDFSKQAIPVMSRNISGEYEDLSVYSSNDGNIDIVTFAAGKGETYIDLDKAGQVRNCTELPNSVLINESRLLPDFVPEKNGEPQILIMHTHTSESYQPNDSGHYDFGYTSRSTDPQKNVVAVGAKIAESIAMHGYTVIHDGTVHDAMYNGAYERSAETVREILAKYPSIKIVLDIHRDAITENDAPVAAVTKINGVDTAQVMIISAADDGNWGNPHYMKNFRFACLLQAEAEADNPGLMRPVLFRYCGYNQELTTGSLLIEVGSHGNTLEQAERAGEILGDSIGKALDALGYIA